MSEKVASAGGSGACQRSGVRIVRRRGRQEGVGEETVVEEGAFEEEVG